MNQLNLRPNAIVAYLAMLFYRLSKFFDQKKKKKKKKKRKKKDCFVLTAFFCKYHRDANT